MRTRISLLLGLDPQPIHTVVAAGAIRQEGRFVFAFEPAFANQMPAHTVRDGYRFEAGQRRVRKKSLNALKDKIRSHTKRTQGQSLQQIIAKLNPMLRGWFNYFKHAHRWTFAALDKLIRRRLRAMLRKHQKRKGFGRSLADQMRWPNAFFATAGLFTLHEAWQRAS